MELDRSELEALDRDALIARAESAGVLRPRILTRPELIDELLLRSGDPNSKRTKRARGFLGLARDLIARVIERGLHLPDAAERFRETKPEAPRAARPALPTVTLAEIYTSQGHKEKAMNVLRQVLEREPENAAARALLSQLEDGTLAVPAPVVPPERDDEPMGSSFMEDGDGTPPEPASMLDADPLPPKYDVDECVAMPVDPATLYVYWELRDKTLERLSARKEGVIALRILIIVPTWDGPRTAVRDVPVHAQHGEWFIRELPERAVIRASIGWLLPGDVFLSAAHTVAVEAAPRKRSPLLADLLARWTPEGTVAAGSLDADAIALQQVLARQQARLYADAVRAAVTGGKPLHTPFFLDDPMESLGASEQRYLPLGASERMGQS